MHRRDGRLRIVLLSAVIAGCAGLPWPDEPGVPVPLSRAANLRENEAFLAHLTAERRAANLPPPVLTPRHQDDIRAFAEDLQAGRLTAAEALRAVDRWGRVAYQGPVFARILDCAAGDRMKLPRDLIEPPVAVISFATAHFRPRSLASDQCAVLVVVVERTEPISRLRI